MDAVADRRRAVRPVLVASPSRSHRQIRRFTRARSAVAAAGAVYLMSQLLLNAAVRTGVEPADDPAYAEKFALLARRPAFFAPDPGRVTVLALGSSRTHASLDAGRFAAGVGPNVEAFNFGTPAGGPLTNALYLRRLLAAGVRPGRVIVEIHPGYLTPADPPFETRWLRPHRLRAGEPAVVRGLGCDVPNTPHLGWRGWAAASFEFRVGLTNVYAPRLLPAGLPLGQKNDAFGHAPGPAADPAKRPKALAATRAQYAPVLADYHVGGPGCAAVRDILATCRLTNLPAALLVSAEDSDVRGWYGPVGNAELAAFVRATADEFGVPVFDGRDWLADADFFDGHHAGPPAAAKFSDRLAAAAGAWVRGAP